MSVREVIYLDRDNTVDLLLKEDGVAKDISTTTRMIVKQDDGDWEVDYNDYNDAFDWDTGTTGKVVLDLAAALATEGVTAGEYVVRLVVYDPGFTDGIVWDRFVLEVA